MKVLQIDDNLETRDALARQLKNQGIRALGASDAESAYLMCYSEKPGAILTGETNPAVKRTMLSLGVVAYFTKPWNFDELLEELGRYIQLHASAAERTHVPAG